MPSTKTEDIKKHGDTLEPLVDRTGISTHRDRKTTDDAGRRKEETEDGRDIGARE